MTILMIKMLMILCLVGFLSSTAFMISKNPSTRGALVPSVSYAKMVNSKRYAVLSEEDLSTVTTLKSPNGQTITLIGTAHLSQKSNEQVQRLIQEIQPQVVLVELDPKRLPRIGINSVEDIKVPRVVDSEDIVLPSKDENNGGIFQPFWIVQEAISEAFSRVARAFLTGMYNNMSEQMDNPDGGGGEFLVAIRQAEANPSTQTVVLGDRSSLTTIKRAASLALQSGDPFGVLKRLQEANEIEMRDLEKKIRFEMGDEADEKEINVAMMEALKEDSQFRDRLFRKLEQNVPEFTQAFLKERDYIMSEAIRRELQADVKNVVGVVGLAHVPGMKATLDAMFCDETIPLLKSR